MTKIETSIVGDQHYTIATLKLVCQEFAKTTKDAIPIERPNIEIVDVDDEMEQIFIWKNRLHSCFRFRRYSRG